MFGSTTTDTITIDASPAVVWGVYTDIDHWSQWTASVTTASLDPSGPLALDSRASIKQPRFPRVTWTVTDIEPERSWRWANHSIGAHTTADHRLTPLDTDRTQVDLSIDQRGVLGRPIGWLVKRTTRRYLKMEAEGLRDRSESPGKPPVIHHHTGDIIRNLTLDPNLRYHGTGKPTGGPTGPRKPQHPNPP